jgi:hypothetical protein
MSMKYFEISYCDLNLIHNIRVRIKSHDYKNYGSMKWYTADILTKLLSKEHQNYC